MEKPLGWLVIRAKVDTLQGEGIKIRQVKEWKVLSGYRIKRYSGCVSTCSRSVGTPNKSLIYLIT